MSWTREETETTFHRGGKMPLTKKGRKVMASMHKHYGKKKGKQVFYASKNKGSIRGIDAVASKGFAPIGY